MKPMRVVQQQKLALMNVRCLQDWQQYTKQQQLSMQWMDEGKKSYAFAVSGNFCIKQSSSLYIPCFQSHTYMHTYTNTRDRSRMSEAEEGTPQQQCIIGILLPGARRLCAHKYKIIDPKQAKDVFHIFPGSLSPWLLLASNSSSSGLRDAMQRNLEESCSFISFASFLPSCCSL